ncbi:MAG: hypothetical protein IMZ67_07705 [Acidobacteria bacterium]|nr:hypothetical protein [Acidobacteriota bacterium]
MQGATPGHRYEMINIQPGYIIVEHEVHSRAMRSFFSADPVPPIDDYREGSQIWKYSGVVQSFHFDIRDRATADVTSFSDLMGLVPYMACRADSDIYRLGELAREQKIWIYVALTHHPLDTARLGHWLDRLRILNRYFGERLGTPSKKILVLPDYFGLRVEFDHGQIMADIGLTAMDE